MNSLKQAAGEKKVAAHRCAVNRLLSGIGLSESTSPRHAPLNASGRVALAVTRQGSHRPVRARTRAYGSSADGFASRDGPRGYSIKLRGHVWEPRCVPHVSLDRVRRPTLRFPPQGPSGRVPLLHRYYQSATTSCRPSRRASLPSLGGTSVCTRYVRSLADECPAKARSW